MHLRIMIIIEGFLFSICFISLSTNLKRSIDVFIMSKLIKHAMISWPLANVTVKNVPNVFLNYLNKITKHNHFAISYKTEVF